MTIVERIQELCREKGTTLKGLETEFGFSNGAMYKWDTNVPGVDRVQKVADYFGVSIDFLVRGHDRLSQNSKNAFNKYSVIQLVRGTGLSANQIITVLDQAKSAVLDEAVVGNSYGGM